MKFIYPLPILIILLGLTFTSCENNDDEIASLNEQISSLQTRLDDANKAKGNAESTITNLEGTITKLRSDISKLEAEIESNTGGIPQTVYNQAIDQFESILEEIGNNAIVEGLANDFNALVNTFKSNNEPEELLQGIQSLVSQANTSVEETLSGPLNEDKTLVAGNEYILDEKLYVTDGVSLTIPAGTVIKAKAQTGANAAALVVSRGGKIYALGTAEKPIIFTSIDDPIQPDGTYAEGESSPGVDVLGKWGGVIVLGHAPGSFKGDVSEVQIEGIPADDIYGLYGGSNPNDNSGIIQYVSIRHGGADIGEGNEINGLTLGGVGNQTVIRNVEVVANKDDGVEFFGGTVNASNLLVWGQGDDGLDIDQAYSGTIYNSVVKLEGSSDHGLEIDGPEGSAEGSFQITNTTIIGATDLSNCESLADKGEIADFRSNAMGSLNRIAIKHFAQGKDVELDAGDEDNNSAISDNYKNNKLTFINIDVVVPSNCNIGELSDIFVDKLSENKSSFSADSENFAEFVDDGSEVGANISEFEWTFWHHTTQAK